MRREQEGIAGRRKSAFLSTPEIEQSGGILNWRKGRFGRLFAGLNLHHFCSIFLQMLRSSGKVVSLHWDGFCYREQFPIRRCLK